MNSVWEQHYTYKIQNQNPNNHTLAFEKCFITFHNIMVKYVILRIDFYCRKLKMYGFKIVMIHNFQLKSGVK